MALKVALVGCGKIADGHIEEIQKLGDTAQVVAVCDLEILMAEQIGRRYGVPGQYDSFDRLLDREKPDVVHITTPPQSHLPLARQAIEAGCHVYVEKPLTPCYADSKELIALAERHNRKLTIGYSYLFDPPAEAMRELLRDGVLGEVVHVESFYGYNITGAFGSAIMGDSTHWVHRLPGKLLQNNIDHVLNRMTEFITDDRPCIKAFGFTRRDRKFGDSRDDLVDELRVMVQGRSTSAYGTFSASIRPVGHFTRIYGTCNTVHVDYNMRTVTLEPTSGLPGAVGRLVPAFSQAKQYLKEGRRNVRRFARSDFHFFAGLNTLISRFYDSIINSSPVPIPYRDILRISAMMDEIFVQIDQETIQR